MIKVTAPVRIDISAGWSDADPFRHEFGGAVLNAAINLRVSGILEGNKLTTSLEKVPSNSGLGTSGAIRTVFLVASNPELADDKIDLIKRVNVLENAIIGQRAGFQDQAAAVFGGVNYWEFRKDGTIKREAIPKRKAEHLHERLVLVYSGDRHLSANVHADVFSSKKFMSQIFTIERMKEIALEMTKDITNERKMAEMINQSWELQKSLHPGMETDSMKRIQEAANGNFLAVRATGAGGGGCMIFYTHHKHQLIKSMEKIKRKIPKMEILPFGFDYEGLKVEKK
jgi:D-glycero-alpha-D-manno-heptose-7-phosphate kinase